jgi:O-antigen/teichoic acid export membrane protein
MGQALTPGASRPADSDLATVARGGALNLVGAAAYAVLAFIVVVVVARGLGPARAGVFLEATALFLVVSHICELGADTGLVRMIARYRHFGRRAAVRRVVLVGVMPGTALAAAAAAALFAGAPRIATVLTQAAHETALVHDLRLLVPFLPASVALTLLLSATRGFGRMTPSVVLDKLTRPVLQLGGILPAALGGLGAGSMALAWALPFLVAAIPAAWWLAAMIRRAERRPEPAGEPAAGGGDGAIAVEFWKFSLPRALAASLKVGVDKLDIILVGALASARAAGLYAAGTRLLIAGTMASVAVGQALGPMISRHFAARARDDARAAYQSAAAWVTVVAWPIYLSLIVNGEIILRIFGPEYAAASAPVAIVAGALLVASFVGPVDLVLLMGGRSLSSLVNIAAALSTNVVLNVLLVPRFGITGAGMAWASSLLVVNLMALAQVWRSLSLHPFGAGSLRAAPAAAVCFGALPAVVRLTTGARLPAFVAAASVGSALYGAFCWRNRHVLHLSALAGILSRRSGAGRSNPRSLRTAVRSVTGTVPLPDTLRPVTRGG